MPAISETYGEILPESWEKLLKIINLSAEDAFLDLGSGKGKIVLQTFLRTAVKSAVGIELNPVFHEEALKTQVHPMQDRSFSFIQGDFLTTPFGNATVALIASPCFGPSILNPLGKRLEETTSIHTVLSLRPMPTLKRLAFKSIIRIECSWDTALCYLYSLVK